MAKWYGVIGFGEDVDKGEGIHVDVISERPYYGDVKRDTRKLTEADKLNKDISVNNLISVVSDSYLDYHFFAIRYISWAGTLWTVDDVEVKSPRLELRLRGVYNGPTAVGSSGNP